MRFRVVMLTMAVVALCALGAQAADISGKWVAQVPGRAGGDPTETSFTFKVEGGKLTGTVGSQRGDQQISEGTVSGDAVSFVVVRQGGQGEIKELYKGTVAGNEIKFTRTREGGGRGGAGGGGGAPGGGGGGAPGGGRGGGRGGPVEFVAKRA